MCGPTSSTTTSSSCNVLQLIIVLHDTVGRHCVAARSADERQVTCIAMAGALTGPRPAMVTRGGSSRAQTDVMLVGLR